MTRVVLYLRVSTNFQAEEGYSIEIQKERLLAYCKAHGWIVVAIVIDPGFSGSNLERPGIQEVINLSVSKKTDMVLVYKLDRLSRSQKDTLYLIEDVFLPNGVDFSSMQEKFDTSTSFGRAMVGILSVFAQLERENIKERTYGGRLERARDGLWHGGGFDPIGYDYIDGQLVVNPSEAFQVQRVFNLYASGCSVSEISDIMVEVGYKTKHGDWSHTGTVSAVLDNELYCGTVHFDGEKSKKNAHAAIISKELFLRVQRLRNLSKNTGFQQKESDHLLTGFVFCGCCGGRYFAKKNRSGNYYYICHSRAKVNKSMVVDPSCKNKNWKKADLEAAVESELLRLASDVEYLMAEIKKRATGDRDSSSASVLSKIEEIDSQIKELMDGYQGSDRSVGEISAQISALYAQKVSLSQSLSGAVGGGSPDLAPPSYVRSLLDDIRFSWSVWNIKQKRHYLRQIFARILVTSEDISFDLAF